jgi:hypothetical protein
LPERALTSSGRDALGGTMFMSGGIGAFRDEAAEKLPPMMRIANRIKRFFLVI